MKWSTEQENAIKTVGENLLVSAGAGSGKTAVLSERVFRLVRDGAPITRFLIVTFTKAAAAEMKGRIRNKLLSDEKTKKYAPDVESAHIETFDSFSMFIAKKYAFELNISRDFTVLDKALETIKTKKIIEETLLKHAKEHDAEFVNLISVYCIKNNEAIRDLILNIINIMNSCTDKESYLEHLINDYFSDEFVREAITERVNYIQNEAQMLIDKAYQMTVIDDANNIIEFFNGIVSLKSYDEIANYLKNTRFPIKPNNVNDDVELRDIIKSEYSKIVDNFGNEKEIKKGIQEKKRFVLKIIELVKEVDLELNQYKHEINCYTFGDIARLAMAALDIDKYCDEIKQMFDFIMVDEYQDTSDIQEAIIKRLEKDNVYMVGDVKQSIYAFRNANCSIFQNKYELYEQNNGGKKIDLNTSYRSCKSLVDGINDMFSRIFEQKTNPINYKNGHEFSFGNSEMENKLDRDKEYGIKVYAYEGSKNPYLDEANLIVNDIIYRKASKFQVYDSHLKSLRDCKYNDFAIIIQSGSSFDDYRRIFNENGVPINIIKDESLSNSDIFCIIKNLFVLLYNIKNETYSEDFNHAFYSVNRSYLFALNDQKIYDFLSKNTFFDAEAYVLAKNIAKEYGTSSLKELFTQILIRYKIYEKLSSIGNIEDNSVCIGNLFKQISQMDALGFTLEDLVNYFDELKKNDGELKSKNEDLSKDAVLLMTIHGSKGLEYPICYFPEFRKMFNREDIKSSFVVSKKYGVIIPNVGVNVYDSLLLSLCKKDYEGEDFEEKLRLLYVAITRAKMEAIIPLDFSKNREIINVRTSKCFQDILHYYGLDEKYLTSYTIAEMTNSINEKTYEKKEILQKRIKVKSSLIAHNKASKEKDFENDIDGLLEFGTKVHYLLEITDFDGKNIDFIKERHMKKYVQNVLNCGLFDNIKNAKLLHEYKFYDAKNHVNGVIDALLIKENEIDIIDFKLKNIDDEKYNEQLHIYEDYIRQIETNKVIKLYLVSSITGEVKEVE